MRPDNELSRIVSMSFANRKPISGGQGLICKLVQLARLHVLLELVIPQLIFEPSEPTRKLLEFIAVQLANGTLKFLHTHGSRVEDFCVERK